RTIRARAIRLHDRVLGLEEEVILGAIEKAVEQIHAALDAAGVPHGLPEGRISTLIAERDAARTEIKALRARVERAEISRAAPPCAPCEGFDRRPTE
ncbi:MAG TPA: hypothetical protein PLT38_04025, partial [Rubrivivax sp.]|nr:hypothetical protein [Rubrivivax sp.]